MRSCLVLLLSTGREPTLDVEDRGKEGSNRTCMRGDLQPLSHLSPLSPPCERALGTHWALPWQADTLPSRGGL